MAGIFISWASSDAAVVDPLVKRLRGLGLNPPKELDKLPRLWEYRHEMTAGSTIPTEVMQAINESTIAVLCLSDEAVTKHKWIRREIDWCMLAQQNGKLKHIIPVKVGPTTAAGLSEISDLVATPDKFLFDYSAGAEDDLARLSVEIFSKLGVDAPKLLPIGVIAMTAAEAAALFDNWQQRVKQGDDEPLWKICQSVGMQGPPDAFQMLTERYGKRPEDIMPFGQASLADIIHDAIGEANDGRVAAGIRPVFPRWLHSELVGPAGPEREAARELWSTLDSLLVIDSLSIFSPEAIARLSRVPPADDPSRVATVCLPPYSRRTGALDAELQRLVQNDAGLPIEPFFKDWSSAKTDRMVTFDMSTSISLRSWLRRKIVTIPKTDPPLKKNANAMGTSSFSATPGAILTSKPK